MTSKQESALKRFQALYACKRRFWNRNQSRAMAVCAKLHPATGGNLGLVHNWGNEQAKAAARYHVDLWRKFSDRIDAKISEAMRDYTRA